MDENNNANANVSEELTLQNGGEFQENFRRLIKVKFGYDNSLNLIVDERSGNLRKMVIDTINSAKIVLDNEEHRFTYSEGEEDKWTRSRVYIRPLTDGKYDMEKGEVVSKKTLEKQLIGTFRLPISGTNLIVRDISLGAGKFAWVYYCHPNAPTGKNGSSDKKPALGGIDEALDSI